MPVRGRAINSAIGGSAALASLLLSAGCPGQDGGVEAAWTITARIQGGYPPGVASFAQVAADGSDVTDPVPDATGGATYEYPGDAVSYPLHMGNRQGCSRPCGFVRLRICPSQTPQCSSAAALKDLGTQEVKAFEVEF